MTGTALILGITGNIGQATAKALADKGWRIRALHREPEKAATRLTGLGNIDWHQGDAMTAQDVTVAAAGVDIIFHGVNPPGYRNWQGLAVPMLGNSIEAARNSGALLMLPGNVYNYGPDAWPLVSERSPQNPLTRKGRIRVEMEQKLKTAAEEGVRCLVLRAGDFFGPGPGSAWFEHGLVKPGRRIRSLGYPGRHDVGHAWAYLPDLAETFARLAERRAELPDFSVFNFGGHYMARGAELLDVIRTVAGAPKAPTRPFPWWLIRILGPFNETCRELLEMRYLWDHSLKLDNSKLVAFLGEEPHTTLAQAVEDTLVSRGCLPERTSQAAA